MPENSGKMLFQDRVLMEYCSKKLLKAVDSTGFVKLMLSRVFSSQPLQILTQNY